MPSIQIKDVPEEVHAVFRRRAAEAGQSLQEYMLAQFRKTALNPTTEELFARVAQHSGGEASFKEVNEILRGDRDTH